MMRMKTGLFVSVACVLFAACASSGDGKTMPPAGDDDPSNSVCGDGTCTADEVGVCADDCGSGGGGGGGGSNNGSGSGSGSSCGNFTCEANLGEDTTTCPADCGTGGGGGGSTGVDCTDFAVLLACITCDAADPTSCIGVTPADCDTCLGGGLGGGGGTGDLLCEGGAADGTCNAAAGEDATTCASDCP